MNVKRKQIRAARVLLAVYLPLLLLTKSRLPLKKPLPPSRKALPLLLTPLKKQLLLLKKLRLPLPPPR